MSLSKPQILFEKFTVIKCLKKSDSSAVYLADNILLDKRIILKTMEVFGSDDETNKRFNREAKILAKLEHRNIIKVLDFGKYQSSQYIVFEYFNGVNLREIINNRSLTSDEYFFLLKQFFSGLEYLHSNNIIHRDLKPENILVDEDLSLKISDFGLAMALNDDFITQTHSIIGTPCYMSPEQVSGNNLTLQSDLFTAGTIVYELFTRKNLFHSELFDETINKVLNFNVDLIENDIEDLPDNIKKIIKDLLVIDVKKRYKSVGEVLTDLGISPIGSHNTLNQKVKKQIPKVALFIILPAIIVIAVNIFNQNNIRSDIDPALNSTERNKSSFDQITVSNGTNDLLEENIEIDPVISELEKDDVENQINKTITVRKSEEVEPDITVKEIKDPEHIQFGMLHIDSYPWSKVYLNNKEIGTTPLEEALELKTGSYSVKFSNPGLPEFTKTVYVINDTLVNLRVNLKKSFGYLVCNVFPWANVFINDRYLGQTPFEKPIPILPGEYLLTLKNPDLTGYGKKIFITPGDTLLTDYTFEGLDSLRISIANPR